MTIVVGHLATPEGQEALDASIAEARRTGARLVVVVSRRKGTLEGASAGDHEADLAALGARLSDEGVEHEVRVISDSTDVAEDLVLTAEESGADLLVIGLRRRSPVGKLILGSNAQRILLEAPCPVLAVKPDRR
ncbi:nucleotide-binding universal stress UspA family protein [Sediminihabitans luteus]|uniref:Nucleotide-binding universal stress UspA family protein n=1 Tax=Sediminihabitans luteus TaxID=1138585 RepID=A0A2M9CQ80_9CELL|nr:universal stress protein [Sediminihabitans luteus]PJJ74064.1 nucleotide-binding universal stress UspA family protein [Sediminihabitans luteus]GII98021.1 universal stress protein [Sediminihabitans luteus]